MYPVEWIQLDDWYLKISQIGPFLISTKEIQTGIEFRVYIFYSLEEHEVNNHCLKFYSLPIDTKKLEEVKIEVMKTLFYLIYNGSHGPIIFFKDVKKVVEKRIKIFLSNT